MTKGDPGITGRVEREQRTADLTSEFGEDGIGQLAIAQMPLGIVMEIAKLAGQLSA